MGIDVPIKEGFDFRDLLINIPLACGATTQSALTYSYSEGKESMIDETVG
jgi:hypothetical protein